MIENDVTKSFQTELHNIIHHIQYNMNEQLNKTLNNHISVEDVKKAVKKLQKTNFQGRITYLTNLYLMRGKGDHCI